MIRKRDNKQPGNKEKIVVMHVCYLNPENQSGYETRVVEETTLLHSLGYRVIIACFMGLDHVNSPSRVLEFYRRLKHTTRSKIYVLPTNHYFDLNDSHMVAKTITLPLIALARLHRVDIMHGQALYSTIHALRAKVKAGTKIIMDVHGVSPEETEMSGGKTSRVMRLQEWEKEALEAADLRIFVSRKMQRYFKDKYGMEDDGHSVVIPCCVHGHKFRMNEGERSLKRAQMGLKDKFVFLYIGTLSIWQWPEAMFSLFAQIHEQKPDSFFYLLLPKMEHEKAALFLKRHNLPSTDYFMDEVPHDKVGSVIGVADAGFLLRKAHPVNYVSSPTKFGEYLAAGVPVIATEGIGDISDIINEEEVGVIVSAKDDGVDAVDLQHVLDFVRAVRLNRRQWADRCMVASQSLLGWHEGGRLLSQGYKSLLETSSF